MSARATPRMRSDGSSVLEIVVDSVPSAGRTVRRHLDGLSEILPAPILHDLRTVVTELVDNSVLHGSGRPIVIVIEVMPDGVTRGTVSDGGQGPVEIAAPREAHDSGLGRSARRTPRAGNFRAFRGRSSRRVRSASPERLIF